MITDKDVKVAENPDEALQERTIKATENRIREQELSLEIDKIVLEYLKKRSA